MQISGTGVALVTPFKKDLSIDYASLENLINYVIEGNVDFLVIMGTTGENTVLSNDEKNSLLTFSKKINQNRVPLVLGIGGNNTSKVINDLHSFDLNNIDAILSVSPYYNKPSQDGIYLHYKLLAENSPVPIILYNVPGRTSSNITAETTLRLAKNFSNIVAIKEASGDMQQVMKIIKDKPKRFMLLSGDDALTLPIIHMGGSGVISVLAQSHPKEFSKMVRLSLNKNIKDSNKIHFSLYDYYEPLFDDGNPSGIKALLELKNICSSHVRPPLVKARKETVSNLKKILNHE